MINIDVQDLSFCSHGWNIKIKNSWNLTCHHFFNVKAIKTFIYEQIHLKVVFFTGVFFNISLMAKIEQ